MIRKNIQITEEQEKLLKREAFEQDVSQSEIFRKALDNLDNYFNKEEKEMTKEEIIEKLKGKYVRVTSEWVEKYDKELYEFLEMKLEGFVRDEENSASQQDLNNFWEGDYWVEVHFSENGMSYCAGRSIQNLNNQPEWGRDKLEDVDDIEQLKAYYEKLKEGE